MVMGSGGGQVKPKSEEECDRIVCDLVREEVEDLQKQGRPLPEARTLPDAEAI